MMAAHPNSRSRRNSKRNAPIVQPPHRSVTSKNFATYPQEAGRTEDHDPQSAPRQNRRQTVVGVLGKVA